MTTTMPIPTAPGAPAVAQPTPPVGGVYLVGSSRVGVLPVEQASAMVNVAEAITERAERLHQADRVADMTRFAQRLRDAMAAARSSGVRLDVDADDERTAVALLAQARARAALAESARFRHVCTTCGMSTLTNPDYQKLIEHNRKVSAVTRGVGMAVFTGGVTPYFMLNSLLGLRKTGPEYHCPRCQGMEAESTVVVFCPMCKTQCDKAVLKTCAKCQHGFLDGVQLDDVWHPLDEVSAPAPAGEKLTELELDDEPTRMAFLPDGRHMLTASQARSVQLWDIGDLRVGPRSMWTADVGGFVKVSKPVVAFSGDGNWVATGKPMSRSFKLLRTADGAEVGRVDWAQVDGWGPTGLAFRHDGSAVAVAFDRVDVWGVSATGLSDHRIAKLKAGFTTSFASIAFSPDGAHLVAAGGTMSNTHLFVWRTDDWTQVAKVPMHGDIVDLTWGPSALAVAVGKEARLVDMPSGTLKAAFTLDATVTGVALSPDGTLLAAASDDHSARVFDIVADREVARISRPFGVTAVAFAPDGRLAVGDAGNSVQFWSPPPHAASNTPWAAPDPAKRNA